MPLAPQDGRKALHWGGHGGNGSGAAVWSGPRRFAVAVLFRIACVHSIPRLFLQPPLEVLPSPTSFVVQPALGNLDVLVCFLHHHNYVAAGTIVVVD